MSNTQNTLSFLKDDEIKNITINKLKEMSIEQLKQLTSEEIELLERKFGSTNIYFLIYIYK